MFFPIQIRLNWMGCLGVLCRLGKRRNPTELTRDTNPAKLPMVRKKVSVAVATPFKEKYTPPKFNMEPENQPLEKEIPFRNHHFQVPC